MNLKTTIATVLALGMLTMPRAADAQGGLAKLAGTARDQSGAAVPGAAVTVTNEKTGEARAVVADARGGFNVSNLRPSSYTIKAEFGGFAPTEYTGILLQAGQDLTLDVELHPAGLSEAVTVTADAPALDLSSARLGVNVNQREVEDLPINGRQMSQLYLQAPGALNSGTGTFSDIRFSGRAVEQNMIRFDGIEATAIIDAAPGNLNGEIPSPFKLQSSLENIQEFRVDSSSYPAEYGTGTGGQISVVTKSGSNAVHGSAFYYLRDDKFDSQNAFDLRKSPLSLKQFGGSIGGPLAKNRAFFFGSYEGYRLTSGINFLEGAPSAAAFQRAAPAIQPLFNAFRAPGAVVLAGASANPDFDILQLQSNATVRENSAAARVDVKLSNNWTAYGRYFRDDGRNDQPEGVTGRRAITTAKPANGVVVLQGVLTPRMINEAKVGYNTSPTRVGGSAPTINGIDLSSITLNISGSVANNGIAGQGASSGLAIPGGLLRQNSATNGRGAPYNPYSLSFIDNLTWTTGAHTVKFGGEFRMIRMETDRLGGTTYTWSNLNDFLANRLQQTSYLSDLSDPSPFNNGATGPRHTDQEYAIAFAQDEWKAGSNLTFNYGLRYDYYTPLKERNDLLVKFDTEKGVILPSTTSPFRTAKNNLQPRVAFTWTPTRSRRTVLRGGFGLLVGPGQTEDQIQPIESDRIASSRSGGVFPADLNAIRANFLANPLNRAYQPRAYTPQYLVPERVWQYSASIQHELPLQMVGTAAYVGSQGRNLFLRSITNRILSVQTNANPAASAVVIRQFDIVNADGSVHRPFAEIDVKTSGGDDNYNAMQLSLARRFNSGLTLNSQYSLSRSYGTTAGSNEALTAANNAVTLDDFDYDRGYNRFDVRHTFNLSALYSLPFGRGHKWLSNAEGLQQVLLGGWDVGAILNGRSGLPLDVRVTRADVVYRTAEGNFVGSPCATCTAVINTPGGGASRGVRRPSLIAGVDPYLKNGRQWLNPAAFTIPAPGEFGNMKRGVLRGPGFSQVDLVVAKRFGLGSSGPNLELRGEVFNLFNRNNYDVPPATLSNALGTGTNQLQPNQPFTAAAAGSAFGKLRSTVGTTVGMGTNRQAQFALRVNF